jgi:hypothetical protein
MKSENLVKGIGQLLAELKKTNGEIDVQIQMNKGVIEEAHANIEQLDKDNLELAVLKADNETFISKIEEIIGNEL